MKLVVHQCTISRSNYCQPFCLIQIPDEVVRKLEVEIGIHVWILIICLIPYLRLKCDT